jgi:hypothetical protein
MEKKFKDWLARCHATLDKTIRFEALADSKTQVGLAWTHIVLPDTASGVAPAFQLQPCKALDASSSIPSMHRLFNRCIMSKLGVGVLSPAAAS